jgi:hypothetical protein
LYNVSRNNFYDNQKRSTIYTPQRLSQFLFDMVKDKIDQSGLVLDPCVGGGSLLAPFAAAGFRTTGIDITDQGWPDTHLRSYLDVQPGDYPTPALVIANPPFNVESKTKMIMKAEYGARPLLPEVWLKKTVSLFGGDVPIVMFAPYGLRLNQSIKSRRWQAFLTGSFPPISSILALPKDIYQDVLFHSEVLFFNIDGLKPHDFFPG